MAKIENHKYSVDEAFRECFYTVPDYQREFVWTDKEVQQLLDDINEQMDSDGSRDYFIGTVLVSPKGSQKNHYDVIDGQQRLTTLFLLLCALRYRFEREPQGQTIEGLIATSYTTSSGETETSLKLEPRYENAGELMQIIAGECVDPKATRKNIHAANISTFGSLENLLGAYETVHRYLADNYSDKESLKKYWGYLANNVIFIQISTDVSTALKIFETINERGVGLNSMDLLKNLLFTHVKPGQFTELKNEWKKVTKPLEENKEKPLRFLRYFLMANYKIQNAKNDATVREDEIYDWFTDKDNAALCDYQSKPFDFVRKLTRNVDRYIDFSEGKANDGKASIAMGNLRRLCGGAFSLHFILLLAAAKLPTDLFDHFVRQLESFLFYYIFTKTPTKKLERDFSVWADDLRKIADETDVEVCSTRLDAFILDKFHSSMKGKEQELTDYLKRYTLHSMQRYRTSYLLAKLTQRVDMAYKGLRTPGSLDEYHGIQVEHILPDTPSRELVKEFARANPGADYDEYKQRLGNLTLLEKPLNIVASNDFFVNKLPEYRKCKFYLTSSIAELTEVGKNSTVTRMNTKLKSFDTWTAESIDERQEMLMGLAKEIWRVVPIAPRTSSDDVEALVRSS